MTSWREAHSVAILAALKAHRTLDVPIEPPVDVPRAIHAADLLLMWRPMPRLFGAFVNEAGSRPGIIVNSSIEPAEQNRTAAHELGHHWMHHGSRADPDLNLPYRPGSQFRSGAEERFAEAFAAWFIMPRKTVLAALERLGVERPGSAQDIYRLSLLLGAPYRATARHLPNLKLMSSTLADRLIAYPPGRVKAEFDQGAPLPETRRPQVWLVDERFNGSSISVHVLDRIVVRLTGMGWQFDTGGCRLLFDEPTDFKVQRRLDEGSQHPLTPKHRRVVLEVPPESGDTSSLEASSELGGQWSLQVIVEKRRYGIDPLWY